MSFVSSAMALFGIAPSHIAMLGTQLPLIEKPKLWTVFAVVVFFFLSEFCIYAASDFLAMKKTLYEFKADTWDTDAQVMMHGENPSPEYGEALRRKSYNLRTWSVRLATLRMFFDFGLPGLLGVAAIAILVVMAARA